MSVRDQAGVIPFRRTGDAVEICLIRTRGRRKWKIPKGFVDAGETAEETALKEAREEAGLEGRLEGHSIGSYEYEKWGLDLIVAVYLMEVSREHDEWDEAHSRERKWKPLETAVALLKDHPVRPLLAGAVARLGVKARR